MALQLVVLYPAAALVLSGIPPWMADSILSRRGARAAAGLFLHPLPAAAAFILATTAWYLPRPFEWALQQGWPGGIERLTVLAAALLFWWPLISPSRIAPPIGFGARMVYLFCLEVALTAVFSYLLMAEHPLYPTYELAPRLIAGLDAYSDQILGGILLSGVSSLVLVGILGANFLRWAKRSEA